MKRKVKYTFIIEKTTNGFSAYSKEISVFTTGNTLTELKNNCSEAMELALNARNFSIDFQIDLKQFFQYYRVINANYLAERIGMNPTLFSQYVKGRKQPSAKQTNRILMGINEIGKELSELQFIQL
jgi:predicted RNase H-like HicB family nuclease